MNAPKNLSKYLAGKLPLAAGFVPLVELKGKLVGVLATGQWCNYYRKERECSTTEHWQAYQRQVMALVVLTLGGTSAKAAAAIGVSPRTVESWRCGRKRLTVEKALVIARAMADA
jgi:hypothetical protein